jgi:capsular exopolysaccharide synthesis family protein
MTSGSAEPASLPPIALPDLSALEIFTPHPAVLDRNTIVGFDSRDARSRPFNLLRTQVAKRISNSKAKIVGITSATPNAGKSFLSLNLAASLSRVAEQSVYLIDLDLRRGSLASALGLEVQQGIADYLEGSCTDLGALGRRVADTNLAVFPTPTITGNSAELLAGERFGLMIDAFRQLPTQSIILCDMPPAFANDDAMIAMQKLDGYIIVVDSGTTTRRQVTDAMEILQPAHCLGAVLNRYNGGLLENYGYGYGYGSKAYDAYYS